MMPPAAAGPSTRARLNEAELSAIAFISDSRGTSSATSALRIGTSNALTTPAKPANASTHGTEITFVLVRMASASASTASSDWRMMRLRRRFTRSAMTPP